MEGLASGEMLIRALREVVADVATLLSRHDDTRRSRPSTSLERRRVAEEAERARLTLDAVCQDLGAWIAEQPHGHPRPDVAETPETPETAGTPEAACAEVTRAQDVLERARIDLQACVETARGLGATWRQVGDALDITPQTAHKRFDPEARRRHAAYMRNRNRSRGD
jgi:hypothetical protein